MVLGVAAAGYAEMFVEETLLMDVVRRLRKSLDGEMRYKVGYQNEKARDTWSSLRLEDRFYVLDVDPMQVLVHLKTEFGDEVLTIFMDFFASNGMKEVLKGAQMLFLEAISSPEKVTAPLGDLDRIVQALMIAVFQIMDARLQHLYCRAEALRRVQLFCVLWILTSYISWYWKVIAFVIILFCRLCLVKLEEYLEETGRISSSTSLSELVLDFFFVSPSSTSRDFDILESFIWGMMLVGCSRWYTHRTPILITSIVIAPNLLLALDRVMKSYESDSNGLLFIAETLLFGMKLVTLYFLWYSWTLFIMFFSLFCSPISIIILAGIQLLMGVMLLVAQFIRKRAHMSTRTQWTLLILSILALFLSWRSWLYLIPNLFLLGILVPLESQSAVQVLSILGIVLNSTSYVIVAYPSLSIELLLAAGDLALGLILDFACRWDAALVRLNPLLPKLCTRFSEAPAINCATLIQFISNLS